MSLSSFCDIYNQALSLTKERDYSIGQFLRYRVSTKITTKLYFSFNTILPKVTIIYFNSN